MAGHIDSSDASVIEPLPVSPLRTDGRPVIRIGPVVLAVCVCALLTAVLAWNTREAISADGLSYLEMAVNAAQNGPQDLFLNAYWSPAYPAILAVALKLTRPSLAHELAVVRSVDWLICLATYLGFGYFLINLFRWIQLTYGTPAGDGTRDDTRFRVIVFFTYTLLFVSNIDIALWLVGPNILLECVAYLAAGLGVRLSLPDSRQIHYVLLGVVLAFGYLVKAALFPLSLVLLALLFVWPVARNRGRRGTALALAVFLLASAPFVAVLSYSKGRLTFGDAGTLTYAWYVNHVPRAVIWQASQTPLPGGAVLRHPAKQISSDPPILRFDLPGPFLSTYPYWYDPSWWYDGLKSRFDLRQQIDQLLRSFGLLPKVMIEGYTVFQLAEQWLPLWAGLAAFAVAGLRIRNCYSALGRHIWLLLWPTVAFLTFALVLLQHRYIVAFLVLGWTSLFAAAWVVVKPDRWIGIALTVTFGLLLAFCPGLAKDVVSNRHRPAALGNLAIAKKLTNMGIRPGDELASVDSAVSAYYARLAGARFTMEVLAGDPAALSKLPDAEVRRIIATLRANGARALFSSWRPAFDNDSGWVLLTGNTYVRMIQ